MVDGKVLDWVSSTGNWKLWWYDPTNPFDILTTVAASGNWSSIRSGHSLVPMFDGRVLDWDTTGAWNLWNYDPASTSDVLPTSAGHGTWSTIVSGHTLLPMNDGKVLDWVPGTGDWRLWKYDATSTSDVLPTEITYGHWTNTNAQEGDQLVPMVDGHVLDWKASTGSWWLWNYVPPDLGDATDLYVDFGDALSGTYGMTSDGSNPVTVGALVDSYNGPNLYNHFNGDTKLSVTLTYSDVLKFRSFNAVAAAKGFGTSQITAMRSNILDTIQAAITSRSM